MVCSSGGVTDVDCEGKVCVVQIDQEDVCLIVYQSGKGTQNNSTANTTPTGKGTKAGTIEAEIVRATSISEDEGFETVGVLPLLLLLLLLWS